MPEGFLKLIHPGQAVGEMLDALGQVDLGSEEVAADSALGRVFARDTVAPEDLPGFDRSQMDGYAVCAADTFGASEGLAAYLELAGEVPMGSAGPLAVRPGQALGISTGGLVPEGADAVVMVENTELTASTVEVMKAVAPGENVIRRDDDVRKGETLFAAGQVIGPAQIGALAGLGMESVTVFRVPTVGIISTGDELVEPGQKPGPGQVRDVNSMALAASVERAGCLARRHGIVKDDFDRLLGEARAALEDCDALLISGGSSAGVRDVTVDVLRELGAPGVLAHGLYLKPGKPTLVAVCAGKPVLGLPGNPASALAVFAELFVPVLRKLRGEIAGPVSNVPRKVQARLSRSVASSTGRLELVPVALRDEGGRLIADPILGRSSLIGTLARAHGNLRIPEGSEGVEQGELVEVELLD